MISLIVCCMDRAKELRKTLPSWLEPKEIDDIIILDWSSKMPLIKDPFFKKYFTENDKIKIIRVENQKYFYRSLSHNLARKFTDDKNNLLLKIDADYLNLDFSWIRYIPFHIENIYQKIPTKGVEMYNSFLVGDNRYGNHSNGFLFINKKDFDIVNGYNENLLPLWGMEDCDLYERLEKNTGFYECEDYENRWLKRIYEEPRRKLDKIIFFNIDAHIRHLDHPREKCHKNDNKDLIEKYLDLNILNFKDYSISTQESFINARIAMEKKIWKPMEYKILDIKYSNRYFIVEPIRALPT